MDEQAVGAERLEATRAAELAERVIENLQRVIHAPEETLQFSVLFLLAEGQRRRDLMDRLDVLYRTAVTDENFQSLVEQYKEIAAALGARAVRALSHDVAAMERRSRHSEDELDDLDNEEEERNGEECRCDCERCADGNHQRCLRDEPCGYANDSDYLLRHPEELLEDEEDPADVDARNLARLSELRRQINTEE